MPLGAATGTPAGAGAQNARPSPNKPQTSINANVSGGTPAAPSTAAPVGAPVPTGSPAMPSINPGVNPGMGGMRPAPMRGGMGGPAGVPNAQARMAGTARGSAWTPELLQQAQQAQLQTPQQQYNNQILQALLASQGPQLAALNAHTGSLYNQMGWSGQQLGLNQQGAHLSHQSALANLHQQMAQTGFDQQGVQSQMDYLAATLGVTGEQFADNILHNEWLQSQVKHRFGSDREFNAFMRRMNDRSFRNKARGFANQRGDIAQQHKSATGDVKSDAVARGAYGTEGTRTGLSDLDANRDSAIEGVGIATEAAKNEWLTTQKGLEHQDRNLVFSYLDSLGGLQQTGQNMMWDHTLQNMSTQQQIEQLGIRQQSLASLASHYGTTEANLNAQLQNSLAQMGLNNTISVGQLMDAVGSNNAQAAAIANQIISDALAMGAR